jgi:hypothetical protein
LKYSEVDKYLAFGQHLAELKIDLQVPTTYNPFKPPTSLKNQVFSTYQVTLPEDYEVVEEHIPEKVLADINKLRKSVSTEDYEKGIKQLVYLGYYVTLCRAMKSPNSKELLELRRNVQRIIEDIGEGKVGLNNRLNDIVEKYRHTEHTPVKTFDLFSEIAHAYYESSQQSTGTGQPLLAVPENGKSKPITILFLAANPKETVSLRLGEEVREIEFKILLAQKKDQLILKNKGAVRAGDLQLYLNQERPTIVHFSGHGAEDGSIILEDSAGLPKAVPPEALTRMFEVLKDNVRCVVLNACFSLEQARAIAQHIDCVIGMSSSISDEAAIAFSSAFYLGLSSERSVKNAFDQGVTELLLQGIKEENTPKLLANEKIDLSKVFLLGTRA